MSIPLLGRVQLACARLLPADVGVTYSIKFSRGFKLREVLLAEPDGGNLDAVTDETLEQVIRENLAKLEEM